jgi:hypothetical protein
MALPTLARTWRFKVGQLSAGNSTLETQTDTLILVIVNSLLGTGTWTDSDGNTQAITPIWTVRSSNNGAGAFGNNDGVNRWSTIADLVHANAGTNHSWIVLRNANIPLEVLIDLNGSTNAITIIVSHSGFGVANGGTDGTATAAPTALNSITLHSNSVTWGASGTTSLQTVVQALFSTDGSDTRIICCRNGHMCGLWLFAKPTELVGSWANPYVAGILGSSAGAPSSSVPAAADLGASTAIFRGFGTTSFVMGMTSEGFTDGALFNTLTTSDGFVASSNPMLPARVASVTASHTGSRALLADTWLGRSNLPTGHGYPVTPTAPSFMQFGSLIVPWNKSVVVTS